MTKRFWVLALSVLMLVSLPSLALAGKKAPGGTPIDEAHPMISAIVNNLTVSTQNAKVGDIVTFQSRTDFDWVYLPNGYTSNFLTAIPANIFERPVVTGYSLRSDMSLPSFQYLSSDGYINGYPSYRYHPGDMYFFITKEVWSVDFTAKAQSSYNCDAGWAFHGQSDNSMDSRGTEVKRLMNVCK